LAAWAKKVGNHWLELDIFIQSFAHSDAGDGFICNYRVLRIFIVSLPYFVFPDFVLSTDILTL